MEKLNFTTQEELFPLLGKLFMENKKENPKEDAWNFIRRMIRHSDGLCETETQKKILENFWDECNIEFVISFEMEEPKGLQFFDADEGQRKITHLYFYSEAVSGEFVDYLISKSEVFFHETMTKKLVIEALEQFCEWDDCDLSYPDWEILDERAWRDTVIGQEQRDFLNNRKAQYPEAYLHSLWDHIETLKENTMVVPRDDTEATAKNIQERGVVFTQKGELVPGTPSECHDNVCKVFLTFSEGCRIATGYALSKDLLWRQHSWCVVPLHDKADPSIPEHWKILETTEDRVEYFGYILTLDESADFVHHNL